MAVIIAVAFTAPAFGGTTLAQQVGRLFRHVNKLSHQVHSIQGSLGNENTKVLTTTVLSDSSGFAEGTVACPAGWLITGGGGAWNSGIQTDSIHSSLPDSDTWVASGHTSGAAGQQFVVYVVCAKLGTANLP
jgi:hypothetical protein